MLEKRKNIIGTDIEYAASLLRNGEVIGIPTETVYGLAANAFDADAVLKIYEVKQRPKFNPIIVHTHSIEKVFESAKDVDATLLHLAKTFWPGPLTILAPKTEKIHDVVTAGNKLVAIRIPNHPVTLKLLSLLDFPLAAPSANLFGHISPTNADHVIKQLGNKIKYVLDGGACDVGVESTIVKVNESGKIVILRQGGITAEQITAIINYKPEVLNKSDKPEAPGMLTSHYAPIIPLYIGNIEELLDKFRYKKIALLTFNKNINHQSIIKQLKLSSSGDLNTAAKNLFLSMHELEKSGAEIIIAELVADEGIGKAINDRLRRAATNF